MSRARREQAQAAQTGRLVWRVLLTRTMEPGKAPELDVNCGGASTAQTIALLRKAAALLEAQTAQTPAKPDTSPILDAHGQPMGIHS